MAKKETLINFSVSSYEGDTPFSLLPKAAKNKIQQLAKEENKWLYIGGQIKNTEFLTEEDLVGATDEGKTIIMMNALAGGCDSDIPKKVVEINLEVEKKSSDLYISITEDELKRTISISVGEDNIIDILHNREFIVEALSKKLNELTEQQISDLRKALRV